MGDVVSSSGLKSHPLVAFPKGTNMFTAAKKLIFSKLGIAVTSLIASVTIVS